ncbi:MAG: hypothetical protein ABI572_06445 [Actinomycetota bacterium]
MRTRVVRFFDDNAAWLARPLEDARAAGTLRFQRTARAVARTMLAGLEGAMLVSRPSVDLIGSA